MDGDHGGVLQGVFNEDLLMQLVSINSLFYIHYLSMKVWWGESPQSADMQPVCKKSWTLNQMWKAGWYIFLPNSKRQSMKLSD